MGVNNCSYQADIDDATICVIRLKTSDSIIYTELKAVFFVYKVLFYGIFLPFLLNF